MSLLLPHVVPRRKLPPVLPESRSYTGARPGGDLVGSKPRRSPEVLVSLRRQRLGRGLDAMLPAVPPRAEGGQWPTARIEELTPNANQPRRQFAEEPLNELAASIRELGVLEPILVRELPGGGFQIIAGERRWRAAQRAGLKEVPIFVKALAEKDAFEAALVENLQREDLNPVETARAFQRLIDDHDHTQESLALRVGKDRSTISNSLRLLRLPAQVLDLIERGELSEGHGRAILGAPSEPAMKRLAQRAVVHRWSVRETERQARAEARGPGGKTQSTGKSANVRDLERRLSQALGSTVTVRDRNGKGRLELAFSDYEALDRIISRLLG